MDINSVGKSAIALSQEMNQKHGNKIVLKKYDQKCVVCGRDFMEVLRDGLIMIACPTNDVNHHAANNKAKEELLEPKKIDIVVEKPLKPKKKKAKAKKS